ncbi:radical SAM family heme chaperone HemW [Gorillibacterium sp. sgz500922]|uniref:radical SAM family heme chaperone HemW n=1 Tax=Gorillibacterium sp. sgz500922 TaxID=3446694 RepID=UPI003F67ED88
MPVKDQAADYYRLYDKRDPICVSHYPNPDWEPKPEEIGAAIGLNQEPPSGNNGAVYVHVPFCTKVCIFCPFNKVAFHEQQAEAYVTAVKKEIELYGGSAYGRGTTIDAVTFGGGTPSALTGEQMADILAAIQQHYRVSPDAQISYEGSPETLDLEKLTAIRKQGANRISIGVQTFNGQMGEYLKLSHTPARAEEVLRQAAEAGFDNIGIDLMYNLPAQTMEEWLADVERAVELDIKHITLFSLCIVPFTPLFQMIKDGRVPAVGTEDDEIDMYRAAKALLESKGYVQYSVWDFAKPGYEDRHVLLYYTQQKDLFSHGPAAFGYINRFMYINIGGIGDYLDRLANGQTSVFIGKRADEREAMHGMMAKGLRMLSVKKAEFAALFGCSPDLPFASKIWELEEKGLLVATEDEVKLTERGIVWGNNVCKEFFSEDNQQSFESRVQLARGKKPLEAGAAGGTP